ncbi:hypothetical protein OIU77_007757 [Salix suchowensis]|uniref:Uncharacterized protein n=1 Tax=Salix suchowensis TaxID=1278906 RepID=A0ABQ9AJB9_9ROSI|nr:hypothetical protein OIU77_007757 [Salix suchowensis]
MCTKHGNLHKKSWMDGCGALYMNKRMEREGKKRKEKAMINENNAKLCSTRSKQQTVQHSDDLMFLGSLLTLVFDPVEANRGSFLHLLDPS